MRWIIFNCLLLASMISAAPDDRHKRHLSFIKNFITSTLLGWNQRQLPGITKLEPDTEYQFYNVPGFDDVLIRAKPSLHAAEETVYQPGDVLEINPFESYIGTNNPKDTLATFQNVNNLLSTGVINGQDTNLLKQTMNPMISNLHTKIVAEDVRPPAPVMSKIMQPVVTKVENPYEINVGLQEDLKPNYLDKQMKINEPVITFSARSNPEDLVMESIDQASILPMCIQQRIDDVVSLGANPQQIIPIQASPIEHQRVKKPHDINRFLNLPSGYDYEKVVAPISPSTLHLNHLNELGHNNPVNEDTSKISDHLYDTTPQAIPPSNQIELAQTLGPIPSQYISKIHAELPKESNTEHEDIKTNDPNSDTTVSHFSYQQINYNNSAISVVKEKDGLKTNVDIKVPMPNYHQVYIPPVINIGAPMTNGVKSGDNTPTNEAVSHYVYTQVSHNNPYEFSKEKDEVKTNGNTYSPLQSHQVNKSSNKNSKRVIENSQKNAKGADKVAETYHKKENVLTNVKTGENVTEKETLSEYISEKEIPTPKSLSIAKEKDTLKTNAHTDYLLPNNYVYVPPVVNTAPFTTHDSKSVKAVKNVPEKGTLSDYIYQHLARHNPYAFNFFKDANEFNTNNHNFYIPPPPLNPPSRMNTAHSKSVTNKNVNIKDDKTSTGNIVKPINISSKHGTGFHYGYRQITHNDSNVNNMYKEGNKSKTNYPLHTKITVPVSYTTLKEELLTNKVTTNSESATENPSTDNIKNNPPVFTEEAPVSFKDNSKVADSNYVYHQRNIDGSSMKIKGNKDGVSIDVNDTSMEGRGDIPEQ